MITNTSYKVGAYYIGQVFVCLFLVGRVGLVGWLVGVFFLMIACIIDSFGVVCSKLLNTYILIFGHKDCKGHKIIHFTIGLLHKGQEYVYTKDVGIKHGKQCNFSSVRAASLLEFASYLAPKLAMILTITLLWHANQLVIKGRVSFG